MPQWTIEKKRDGQALSPDEIAVFIDGFTRGTIPDYQMAALAMAIYFRGMTFEEITALTEALMRSGRTLDLSGLSRPTADKHSTGGIGDKVSLVLAPLVAACGVAVPMISGRGLGLTGGTLDKLEAIPRYRTRLPISEFLSIVEACGCSIIGQTEDLAPADGKLYALRDVTGTVPSIPLIAASIMSKKLAEGASVLVFDVKCGQGAFMREMTQARELARTLVAIGQALGRRVTAFITGMDQPLGRSVGNALEVQEAIEALKGRGPEDLVNLTLALGAEMLTLARADLSQDQALTALYESLQNGSALRTFQRMVRLHGGDPGCVDDPSRLPEAPVRRPLPAPADGYVAEVAADAVGRACLILGAGRRRVEDAVDPAVGLSGLVKVGDRVSQGDPLAIVHARSLSTFEEARAHLQGAFRITDRPPSLDPLIREPIV